MNGHTTMYETVAEHHEKLSSSGVTLVLEPTGNAGDVIDSYSN